MSQYPPTPPARGVRPSETFVDEVSEFVSNLVDTDGTPFELAPWQQELLADLLDDDRRELVIGYSRKYGRRRLAEAYIAAVEQRIAQRQAGELLDRYDRRAPFEQFRLMRAAERCVVG